MLGIVKPQKMELLVKDCLYYKLYYCSVCRHLVRNNNRAYAFVNSYEGTLLAMLYNEMVVQDLNPVKDRCSGLPLVKVPALAPDHEAVQLGAAISLLAFQVKFQDNLNDENGFWIRRYNHLLAGKFNRSFRKMEPVYRRYGIDLKHVSKEQEILHRMERDSSLRDIGEHLTQWGGLFAYILSQPFSGKIEAGRFTALRHWLCHLGKILYLVDSMDDLHRDQKSGEFNLLLRAEPDATPEDEKWRESAYNKYRQRVETERAGALSLLPSLELNESYPIVHNILTHGLDREMRNVFDTLVSKNHRSQNLLFNCQDF